MARNISLTVSIRDGFSAPLSKIQETLSKLHQETERMGDALDALNRKKVTVSVNMTQARQELEATAGAGVGSLAGLASGGLEIFSSRDEYFKSLVQEKYQQYQQEIQHSLTSGSITAANREESRMAFSSLMGSETEAAALLEDLQSLAASFSFSQTGLEAASKAMMLNGLTSREEQLKILTSVGRAGTAMGLSEENMAGAAVQLGQIRSSSQVSLADMASLMEQNIPAFDYLAAELKTSKEEAVRNAMIDVQENSEAYQEAKLAGDGAEMGRLLIEAKTKAEKAYMETESYQTLMESQTSAIDKVRNHLGESYWNLGYEMNKAFQRGLAAVVTEEEAYYNDPENQLAILQERFSYDGLDWAELQTFDYLVGPLDITTPDTTTVVDWIKAQRAAGRKSKAILPDTAADHEGIINFSATGIKVASGTLTAAQYCSRIAGIIAGTSFEQSATYVTLPEVLDAGRLTKAEADAAEEAGKFVILYDGQKFKTGRAVNSLTTTAQGKGDAFKKIKIVEVMDPIKQDITLTAEDYYVGKYPNSYDSRCLLISAIKGYLDSLAADQILGPGPVVEIDIDANRKWLTENGFPVAEMSDQEIKVANTGSIVNLKATIQILDVIEDINLPILLAQ